MEKAGKKPAPGRPGRIGVLMGGLSAERDVSLESGSGVLAALQGLGYACVAIDWAPGFSLPALIERSGADVIWNALHGTLGEDGAVQGLLACLGIPYTGSGILASALAMDKLAAKHVFSARGIPTPRWRVVAPDEPAAAIDWTPPLVVKPSCEGSSVGVSIVERRADLEAALARARAYHGATLLEEYIAGAEVVVGILGGEVLGSLEVRPALGFYDYEAKYRRDDTQYLVPPREPVIARAESLALAAHQALGCGSYSRVDLRVAPGQDVFVLEVNTLPGMTSHSLLPKIAHAAGISYASLCERILTQAQW